MKNPTKMMGFVSNLSGHSWPRKGIFMDWASAPGLFGFMKS
jgi:hypothetical protein